MSTQSTDTTLPSTEMTRSDTLSNSAKKPTLANKWPPAVDLSQPILNNALVVDIPCGEDIGFKAVRSNDLVALEQRLHEGLDVDAVTTATVVSPAAFPRVYIIKDLSRMVRLIRLQDYGMLHVAVVHGTLQTIKYLLSKGINVNMVDMNGVSPLSIAAAIHRPDVVGLLLDHDAEIDVQSVSGRTPLIQAINNKDVASVQLLLAAGANVDRPDNKGMTPLFMCISAHKSASDIEILHALIDGGCTVDKANSKGATALMFAVGVGRKDIAAILLKAGANINKMDRDNKAAFDFALGVNTAMFLLNNGATTDWPDKKGQRPMDRAAHVGHIPMLRLLLGSDCRRSAAILDVPRVVQVRQQWPVFDRWLQEELFNPRDLKRLCRQTIRLSLSPHNTQHISELPVPTLVKDFLLAKNLDLS